MVVLRRRRWPDLGRCLRTFAARRRRRPRAGVVRWRERGPDYDPNLVPRQPIEAPTPEVAALAGSMSEEGRRVFYLASPKILDRAAFGVACPEDDLGTVLGCYAGGKIYILRVTRPELTGVMEVAAAHEMLHAFGMSQVAGHGFVEHPIDEVLGRQAELVVGLAPAHAPDQVPLLALGPIRERRGGQPSDRRRTAPARGARRAAGRRGPSPGRCECRRRRPGRC